MTRAIYIVACSGCSATHHSPDHNVPVGWSTCQGHAFCPDCVAAGMPARLPRQDRDRRSNRRRAA